MDYAREGNKVCEIKTNGACHAKIVRTDAGNYRSLSGLCGVRYGKKKKGGSMKLSVETQVNRFKYKLNYFEALKYRPIYSTLSPNQKKEIETSILYCQERINEMTYDRLMHEARG